jgi:hypothetical protein
MNAQNSNVDAKTREFDELNTKGEGMQDAGGDGKMLVSNINLSHVVNANNATNVNSNSDRGGADVGREKIGSREFTAGDGKRDPTVIRGSNEGSGRQTPEQKPDIFQVHKDLLQLIKKQNADDTSVPVNLQSNLFVPGAMAVIDENKT